MQLILLKIIIQPTWQKFRQDGTQIYYRKKLAEQDELKALFEAASPAEDYKEDIDLDPEYREVTAFRMNRSHFLVQHTPTTLINSWSAMTGPRSLRTGVVAWVDEIQSVFPPTSKKED